MPLRDPDDLTVGDADQVRLILDGRELTIVESYEIKMSVMTQPAGFSLRIGSGDVARDLLKLCRPGMLFQLYVGEVLMQSGIVDGRGVPSNDSTVVEVKGRDFMRKLMNCHVEEDITLREKTYYDITRKVMNLVGLENHKLVAGNGANRRAVTSTAVKAVPAEEQTRVIETGLSSVGGSKVEFKWLKAKVGQRWYDWLQEQYRLAGMFLWCAGNGDFILSTPGYVNEPSYVLVRERGARRNTINILRHSWSDDTTNRHAHYIVYGRFGAGKGGRNKIKGEYVDAEMVNYGFSDVITYHDDHVSTTEQAEQLARRYASEERRAGWQLSYTMMGHRTPAITGDGVAIWGPDTVAKVRDDELGIVGPHYLESVTLSCKPQKETTIELIRPEDLLYVGDANKDAQKKAKSALGTVKGKQEKPVQAKTSGGATGEWNEGGVTGSWQESTDISWKWDADAPQRVATDKELASYR